MTTTHSRRRTSALCTALAVLALATTGPVAAKTTAAGVPDSGERPIVTIDGGPVRGLVTSGVLTFRGLPYAAAPTGRLRWKPPHPPADWNGVRDASAFAPSCPQPASPFTIGPTDEDCLYLNVSTPKLDRRDGGRPVLVWIHGGGSASGAGRDYDGTKLAANGIVVVTINYRLGALGYLAHPALATRPGGPTGNYGLMDQQAALRWVQDNIRAFGGDPTNVTIAGESSGGQSVLAHVVSQSSRGLFQRAIVQSGSFALTQQPLAAAQADGEAFATRAGCPDQTAECLRNLPVSDLVSAFIPGAGRPVIIDGAVLKESIGTALAAGRFARVPILNGMNHDEERVFVTFNLTVSQGTFVPVLEPVTTESYQRVIGSVLGVSDTRAAAIAAEYPLEAYDSPILAFSALVGDANFACTALQQDLWTSQRVPTFAYEFNDDDAPLRFPPTPIGPPVATHGSEMHYIFDLPDAPIQDPLSADQEQLATAMRRAWTNFAANGNPSSAALPWPAVDNTQKVMSLVSPQPVVETVFAAKHHCPFWTA